MEHYFIIGVEYFLLLGSNIFVADVSVDTIGEKMSRQEVVYSAYESMKIGTI